MIEILSNGSKWAGEPDDTIDELIRVLEEYTLDPKFEGYGNFVNRNPQWRTEEIEERYNGCTVIFGNFLSYSHVFNIVTDDEDMICQIEKLVEENKKRHAYIAAKQRMKQ